MSNLNVKFPDALYNQLKEFAERNRTSVNQFVLTAVAKEIGRLEAEEKYRSRIEKAASTEEALRLLRKAPDVEPENPADRLD